MEKQAMETMSVEVGYPPELKTLVKDSSEAWKRFCTLPQVVKNALGFSNYGGYELKLSSKGDKKELLHYTKSSRDLFKDYVATLPDHQAEIVAHLTEVSEQIITMSLPLITSFLNDAEKRTGQEDLTQDALSAQDHYVLRYLHYFPSSDTQEEIAAAHCDIGGFTLHLAQDIPGLQFLYADGLWKDVVFDGEKTIIFPGIGMQYRTKGQIKATCHRVVSNAESREIGRYSSVLFANWSTGGRWNKEKYGGLSEQTPGFNYDLSHEEMLKFIDDEKDFSGV